ncbi:unnamed protein product, partial [Thlaspi arvense]
IPRENEKLRLRPRKLKEISEASKPMTRNEESEQVQNPEPDQILSQRRSLLLTQRKWWISVSLCLFLVLLGDILVMLLLNFFYGQDNREDSDQDLQYKGTWTQALIQNAAKLFSLGKLYANYGVFTLISATQLIFTAIFTAIINRFKFNRWIIISIILTLVVYVFGSPEFRGEPNENEEFYSIQAWLTFAASVALALSLCLFQLGFEKIFVKTKRYGNKKVFRMVLEMQICVSFVASVVCLIGLFASGEFKELQGDSKRFKKGETYYVLSLVGLALSWQVWGVGLIGVFGDVVHMCASPLVALVVVLAYDLLDDYMSWPRIGALIGSVLALGSYFYSLHKKNEKEMTELNQRANNVEV